MAAVEIDASLHAEPRDGLSGAGVQRIEVLIAERQDASVGALAPIRHATIAAPNGEFAFRYLLHPYRPTCLRVERLDQADPIRRIQHAAHHDRRRAEIVARTQAWIRLEQGGSR